MERIDFIFSYWIFAWYLLYIFKIVDAYNPKFAIIAGLIENLCILLMMIYYNTKIKLVILFVIMMIILKIIPIYTIWNKNIQSKDIEKLPYPDWVSEEDKKTAIKYISDNIKKLYVNDNLPDDFKIVINNLYKY